MIIIIASIKHAALGDRSIILPERRRLASKVRGNPAAVTIMRPPRIPMKRLSTYFVTF